MSVCNIFLAKPSLFRSNAFFPRIMQFVPFASAEGGQHCSPTMGNKMALLKRPGLELYLINEALALKGQARECVMVPERDALKGESVHIRHCSVH